MKAIVVREFGPPSVMKLEEVPTPEPGPGEVLIKVHAVSVNRTLDTKVRAGKYARPRQAAADAGRRSVRRHRQARSGRHRAQGRRPRHRAASLRQRKRRRFDPHSRRACLGRLCRICLRAWRTAPRSFPDGLDFATATVVTRHAPTAFTLLRDQRQGAARRMGAGDGRGRRARQRRRPGREISRRQGDRGGRRATTASRSGSISAPMPA